MIVIGGKEVFTTLEELVNPAHTALLLIDIQNDFCSPGGYFEKAGANISTLAEVPARVKPVLEAARRAGVMPVHVQHTLYPGFKAHSGPFLRFGYVRSAQKYGKQATGSGRGADSFDVSQIPTDVAMEGTWGWQFVDQVAPRPGELIVRKHRPSAFIGTDMDMILRSNSVKSVVIVGDITDGCVEATARDAQYFDYYTIVLRDCVATTAPNMHEAALLLMTHRMDVVDSSEVRSVWSSK